MIMSHLFLFYVSPQTKNKSWVRNQNENLSPSAHRRYIWDTCRCQWDKCELCFVQPQNIWITLHKLFSFLSKRRKHWDVLTSRVFSLYLIYLVNEWVLYKCSQYKSCPFACMFVLSSTQITIYILKPDKHVGVTTAAEGGQKQDHILGQGKPKYRSSKSRLQVSLHKWLLKVSPAVEEFISKTKYLNTHCRRSKSIRQPRSLCFKNHLQVLLEFYASACDRSLISADFKAQISLCVSEKGEVQSRVNAAEMEGDSIHLALEALGLNLTCCLNHTD